VNPFDLPFVCLFAWAQQMSTCSGFAFEWNLEKIRFGALFLPLLALKAGFPETDTHIWAMK